VTGQQDSQDKIATERQTGGKRFVCGTGAAGDNEVQFFGLGNPDLKEEAMRHHIWLRQNRLPASVRFAPRIV
jgi:hypothetical protein